MFEMLQGQSAGERQMILERLLGFPETPARDDVGNIAVHLPDLRKGKLPQFNGDAALDLF